MSGTIHAMAQLMFGKASIDECGMQEVQTLADKYPYFAPAQFLLLQKLKQENSNAYEKQLQKSVLYYHNPLEFEYFISSEKFYIDASELENLHGTLEQLAEPVAIPHDENQLGTGDFTIESDAQTSIQVQAANEEIEVVEPLDVPVAKKEEIISEPTQAADDSLVFEPYHTVDYFASQGIKPSQEPPKDKFGKQLKSFTEWLKTMKRLPVAELQKTDASGEKTVLNMATHSVDDTDVVTEAMAEVWLKQGNHEKAMEIYNKLSLLNPSKKAFFAAKIENLKRS